MGLEVRSPDVVVRDTGTVKGRGVYAARDFRCGELVEECPVILVDMATIFLPATLKTMVFGWKAESHTFAIALGYGSLYNHDNPASLRREYDMQNQTIRFLARRDIATGEELSINYDKAEGVSDGNRWFEDQGIEPITGAGFSPTDC